MAPATLAPPPTPSPPPSGLGWTAIRLPADEGTSFPEHVAYGGAVFVGQAGSHGYGDALWVSANGIDWASVPTTGLFGSGHIDQIVAWQGEIIGAGIVGEGDVARAAFWRSSDGITWDQLPDAPSLAFFDGDIPFWARQEEVQMLWVEGNDLFAVGTAMCGCDDDHALVVRWKSSDGVTWARNDLSADFNFYASQPVDFEGTWFRASPGDYGIVASSDRQEWRLVWPPQPLFNGDMNRLVITNWGMVAVGYVANQQLQNEALIVGSTDGLSWIRSSGWPGLGLGEVADITSSPDLVVAVGAGAGGATDPYAWISPPISAP